MNQKISFAQFLWIGLKGTTLNQDEKDFIKNHPPGGVILFSRNYESPEQLYNLNKEIQDLCINNGLKVPAFIGIDMEGGRVQRLKEPFTVWPAMKKVSELDSTSKAYDFGLAMGLELKSVGINMDFSPCVDTLLNEDNEVIGDRSFGSDPEEVGKFGSAVVRGLSKAGILTCIKHFPGHGYSAIDSHEDLPIDERSYDEIHDIQAFVKSLRAKPTFIMPGHLMFPNVDPDFPVPLSEIWIKDILLDKLRCRALLISDDLEMGAMTKYDFKESVLKIYNLGFHQLLFCHGHEKAEEALSYLYDEVELDKERLNKILDQKQSFELLPPEVFDNSSIGHKNHKELADEINEGVKS
jgi:beta-N-acetylhexosaminidase